MFRVKKKVGVTKQTRDEAFCLVVRLEASPILYKKVRLLSFAEFTLESLVSLKDKIHEGLRTGSIVILAMTNNEFLITNNH